MPQSYEYFLRFPNKVTEMFRWAKALYKCQSGKIFLVKPSAVVVRNH